MKTPREILLEQNRHHDSRLEEIQRAAIAKAFPNRAKRLGLRQSSGAFQTFARALWSELILPARRIWLGYAFIWVAIAVFYLATADHSVSTTKATSAETIANWKEQNQILAELTKQPEHEPADRPKPAVLSPRSEASHTAMG